MHLTVTHHNHIRKKIFRGIEKIKTERGRPIIYIVHVNNTHLTCCKKKKTKKDRDILGGWR